MVVLEEGVSLQCQSAVLSVCLPSISLLITVHCDCHAMQYSAHICVSLLSN